MTQNDRTILDYNFCIHPESRMHFATAKILQGQMYAQVDSVIE